MLELHIGNVLTTISGDISSYINLLIKEECSYSIQGAEFSTYGAANYCPICKKITEKLTWEEQARCPRDGQQYRKCLVHGIVRPIPLWDGRKFLYDARALRFPTGLIGRVCKVLRENNLPYKFVDERIAPYTRKLAWHGPKLRYYQEEAVKTMVQKSRGIVQACTASGKCFRDGTNILMYNGTIKKVEDIKAGDLVMGMDSKPRTVVEVHKGEDILYRVQHRGGTYYTVTKNHILTGIIAGTNRNKRGYKSPDGITHYSGDLVDISVADWFNASKTFKSVFKGFTVKNTERQLFGLEITECGVGSYTGFSVAEKDKHFLLGDFTVVHNSNVIASIVAETGVNTLILAHTAAVFQQLYHTLKDTLKLPIGRIGDGYNDIKKITVAMPQSLVTTVKVPKKKMVKGVWKVVNTNQQVIKEDLQEFLLNTEALLIDEAHRIACDTVQLVANSCVNAFYRIGVSATPYRADLLDILIESTTGKVNYKYTATQGIKDGYISQPTIHLVKFKQKNYPLKKTVTKTDPKTGITTTKEEKVKYIDLYTDRVINNDRRNILIATIAYKHYVKNESVLIIVRNLEHGKNLYDKLKYLGSTVKYVNGENNTEELKEVLTQLETGECRICVASGIFNEGINVTGLNVCINTTACDSPVTAMQILGRTLRRTETKNKIDFYDIADYSIRWLGQHAVNREEMYRTEPGFILLNETEDQYLTKQP